MEAERLWSCLGCTKKQWDMVDKHNISIVPSYDSWSFPFFLVMMGFLYYDGGVFFTKYIDMRAYPIAPESGFSVTNKISFGENDIVDMANNSNLILKVSEFLMDSFYRNICEIFHDLYYFIFFCYDFFLFDMASYNKYSLIDLFEIFLRFYGSDTVKNIVGFFGYFFSHFLVYFSFDVNIFVSVSFCGLNLSYFFLFIYIFYFLFCECVYNLCSIFSVFSYGVFFFNFLVSFGLISFDVFHVHFFSLWVSFYQFFFIVFKFFFNLIFLLITGLLVYLVEYINSDNIFQDFFILMAIEFILKVYLLF